MNHSDILSVQWTKVDAEQGEFFWIPSGKQLDYYSVYSKLYKVLVETQFSQNDLINEHELRIIPCNINGTNRLQFVFRMYSPLVEQWEYYLLPYAQHVGQFPF